MRRVVRSPHVPDQAYTKEQRPAFWKNAGSNATAGLDPTSLEMASFQLVLNGCVLPDARDICCHSALIRLLSPCKHRGWTVVGRRVQATQQLKDGLPRYQELYAFDLLGNFIKYKQYVF